MDNKITKDKQNKVIITVLRTLWIHKHVFSCVTVCLLTQRAYCSWNTVLKRGQVYSSEVEPQTRRTVTSRTSERTEHWRKLMCTFTRKSMLHNVFDLPHSVKQCAGGPCHQRLGSCDTPVKMFDLKLFGPFLHHEAADAAAGRAEVRSAFTGFS